MEIVNNFNIVGQINKIEPIKNGLVNKTYLVETSKCKYILQRINNYVFKNPILVMNNIELITNKLKLNNVETLNIIKTLDNNNIYIDNLNESYYRMYDYLNTMEQVSNNDYHSCLGVGKTIGEFQKILSNTDIKLLKVTIDDFHNTPKRLNKLINLFNSVNDSNIRKQKSTWIYDYIIKNKDKVNIIQEKINNGLIPIRIAHNDTKLNNVMFDKITKKAVALIDLDTVMPGSVLFDYGDAIRTCASNSVEDDLDISLINFNDKLFASFTVGYLSKMYNVLTKEEINLLVNSVETITLECAIRFLTDYLENDVYFKIDYPEHNLVRAINQIILFNSCLFNEKRWQVLINDILNRLYF